MRLAVNLDGALRLADSLQAATRDVEFSVSRCDAVAAEAVIRALVADVRRLGADLDVANVLAEGRHE